MDALKVHVTTSVPYTHTSNTLCERQNRVLEHNPRILMKQESTKDWIRLLTSAVLTMNSQESSSTGYTPQRLFHAGHPAWFFKTLFPEVYKSPVGDWLEHRQDLANLARDKLKHVRERELTRRNRMKHAAGLQGRRPRAEAPLAIAHVAPQLSAGPLLWALAYYKDKWIPDPCEVQSPPRWRVALCT